MTEPEYYTENGLSPIGAFEQGLISYEEYIGFIKGNIIKYTVRCGKKDNPVKDMEKAIEYCEILMELFKEEDVSDLSYLLKMGYL